MTEDAADTLEHVDVLIIGAGISGIGAAYYLQRDHPNRTYAILEARDATGGTWDLFRYPGIRSDSDLFTFGYEFAPWRGTAIADGASIRDYVRRTAAEYGIDTMVRTGNRVRRADWSSDSATWTVHYERADTGDKEQISASWIFGATGYYDYDAGFTPAFDGRDQFRGDIVHPQHWPSELDYTDKRVVVIGSGATAVTLVPSMAPAAAHVTMLQRSPSYVMSMPAQDTVANFLIKVLGVERGSALARRKNIFRLRTVYRACRRFPKLARRLIRGLTASALPKGYPVDEHFGPHYDPWDQRLCLVPDADLFKAISSGSASVVTDHVESFTETGVALRSGKHLDADIIVTATGLNLAIIGNIALTVDGNAVEVSECVAYKGMLLSGVPNFAFMIGYVNASWTLRVGLVCEQFCELLSEMDARAFDVCEPRSDNVGPTRPLMDLSAGYMQRATHKLPRQGSVAPWVVPVDYYEDKALLSQSPMGDTALDLRRARGSESATSKYQRSILPAADKDLTARWSGAER